MDIADAVEDMNISDSIKIEQDIPEIILQTKHDVSCLIKYLKLGTLLFAHDLIVKSIDGKIVHIKKHDKTFIFMKRYLIKEFKLSRDYKVCHKKIATLKTMADITSFRQRMFNNIKNGKSTEVDIVAGNHITKRFYIKENATREEIYELLTEISYYMIDKVWAVKRFNVTIADDPIMAIHDHLDTLFKRSVIHKDTCFIVSYKHTSISFPFRLGMAMQKVHEIVDIYTTDLVNDK